MEQNNDSQKEQKKGSGAGFKVFIFVLVITALGAVYRYNNYVASELESKKAEKEQHISDSIHKAMANDSLIRAMKKDTTKVVSQDSSKTKK